MTDVFRIDVDRRSVAAILLGLLAAAFVAARLALEVSMPLTFDEEKTWIYVRDAVTLGPASFAGLGAILLARPRQWLFIDRPRKVVAVAALLTLAVTYVIARWVLLGLPHVVDEAAYLWQADVFAHGHLTTTPGPASAATIVQYVGDLDGKRLSVFFPGSAFPLAIGQWLGSVTMVNPLLTAALCVITFWSGRRLFNARVGAIASVFYAFSPFTVFQGASFFGQVWTGFFVVPAVTLALLPKRRFEPAFVGFCLAGALLSRPVSAVVAGLAVLVIEVARAWANRAFADLARRGALAVAGGLLPLALFLAYNYETTGSALDTVHRLLLPDETAQLGKRAIINVVLNVAGLAADFNGLALLGLLLVVPALWSRSRLAVALVVYPAVHLGAYALYYNHGISYGPRYLFEVFPLLLVVSAYGLTRVPRLDARVPLLLGLAAMISLGGAVPARAHVFHERATYLDLAPIVAKYGNTPALVVVTAGPYKFPDPMYPAFAYNGQHPGSKPLVFVRDSASERCQLVKSFPGRALFLLDMDEKAAGQSAMQALHARPTCS